MSLGVSPALKPTSGFSMLWELPAKPAAVMARRDGVGAPPAPVLGGLPLGTFLVHRGDLCWPHPEHQGEGAQAIQACVGDSKGQKPRLPLWLRWSFRA